MLFLLELRFVLQGSIVIRHGLILSVRVVVNTLVTVELKKQLVNQQEVGSVLMRIIEVAFPVMVVHHVNVVTL